MSHDSDQASLLLSGANEASPVELGVRFRKAALHLSDIGAKIDVKIRPFLSPELPYFMRASRMIQIEAVVNLEQYVLICQSVMASGRSLTSSREFVWRAFKVFGWIPGSDLFHLIDDDDIIEIYNQKHTQVFRNFRFFEFCSYTLEDLFTRPWTELFIREDASVPGKILAMIEGLTASGERQALKTELGLHRVFEADSSEHFRIDLDVKHIAILYGADDKPQAYLGCERAAFV